jgi:hypothetical protein
LWLITTASTRGILSIVIGKPLKRL